MSRNNNPCLWELFKFSQTQVLCWWAVRLLLLFSVTSVETRFFRTAVFWLPPISVCSREEKRGHLQGPNASVAPLLPLQPWCASAFMPHFSTPGWQKVCEGSYFKPSHSPCLFWEALWQRKWWSLGHKGSFVSFFWCWLPSVIYPDGGGTFTLQTVCACCWTQRGVIISALRLNVWLHYPVVKQGLVFWMQSYHSEALWLWELELAFLSSTTLLSCRHANASDACALTSNKVLQKSIASCL